MAEVGDVVRAGPNRWIVKPPTHCRNGHELKPGNVLVGHQPCRGHGTGHTIWHCLTCFREEPPTYGPALGPHCKILDGPALVRISNRERS
ncbi:hypothetical protein [Mycolicibacterium vinylchloridicum]|uniref:hypothetical protein n=1 Tax=Mycolicibacterium vinylchloridicum TaxID=2736928 RepID=UPI0015CE7C81|nr:hypothetical protein [Mycolicibacterium vinylchloridicum]